MKIYYESLRRDKLMQENKTLEKVEGLKKAENEPRLVNIFNTTSLSFIVN